jgi:hypothetical protein
MNCYAVGKQRIVSGLQMQTPVIYLCQVPNNLRRHLATGADQGGKLFE